MENFNVNKLQLLQDIGRLIKVIDDETDWFIASVQEKEQKRKDIARYMSDKKQEELVRLAKEVNERYK